jgi:hypothetical protein
MARTPGRYRPPMGSRDSAEAAFKSATTKPPEEPSRRTGPAGRTGSSRRCARRRAFEALRPAVGFRENGSAAVQAGPDVLFGERLLSGVRNTDWRKASVSASDCAAPTNGLV